jgi:hypothetical protein
VNALIFVATLIAAESDSTKGWIGLMVAPGEVDGVKCARVLAVAPLGPSVRKIARGDCIASADGRSVFDVDSLNEVVASRAVGDLLRLRIGARLVEVAVAPRPVNAFAVLCEESKRGRPRVRIAFDGKRVEIEMRERASVGDARAAIGAPASARPLINPRMRCDGTASPMILDATDTSELENDDQVVFYLPRLPPVPLP